MPKGALHRLKGAGYLTPWASVFLLAAVSWSNAQKSTFLGLAFLGFGWWA